MKNLKQFIAEQIESRYKIGDGKTYILEYDVVNTNRRNMLVFFVETFDMKPMGRTFGSSTQWDDMLGKFFDFVDNDQKPVLYNTAGKIVMDENKQKIPKKPKFIKKTSTVKEF